MKWILNKLLKLLTTSDNLNNKSLDKFDPLDAKCDDLNETYCRHPDWKDVPHEKQNRPSSASSRAALVLKNHVNR